MIVTHAKVSGLANPADPDLVGGEDWDAQHVISGPDLVGVALLRTTEGGAILSQNSDGFASAWTKTATGTYTVQYDPADFGNVSPIVLASFSRDGNAAPIAVRWALEDNGVDYYIKVTTINGSGDPVNISDSASLTVFAATIP